jgi:hypothetical protein
MHNDTRRVAMLVQSGYYVGTGLLPFVSRSAFEAVTGPKREWWLVQTVGALVTVVGGALASGAARDRVTPELLGVALGSAAALATIDVVYVARRRISPAYLLDAALQTGLFAVIARSGSTSSPRANPA